MCRVRFADHVRCRTTLVHGVNRHVAIHSVNVREAPHVALSLAPDTIKRICQTGKTLQFHHGPMISKTNPVSTGNIRTADHLYSMPDDGNRYELLQGVLRMMSPAGSEHGRIAGRILRRLGDHVETHKLGETFAAETGFRIGMEPDTVRAPDAAFVSRSRLPNPELVRGYLPLAPDLAVEVISPSDSFSDVETKAFDWLQAGTQIVLVADPANLTLLVFRNNADIQILRSGDTFHAGNICGDWQLKVDDAFHFHREM